MDDDIVLHKNYGKSATGSCFKPGRDPAERGRGKGTASGSRNSKGSKLRRDAASTLRKGKASNSGRSISSISRYNVTLNSARGRGSISGKGATVSLGRGTTDMGVSLRSRTDEGSSSAKIEPQISSS
ncbi:hypothetical protein BT93_F0674 [Corymbia citriodora subsp. variegata]|nr:hypothetical protein BT93_F0674 [Corymbia citriodora subsp. variegata]